MKKFLALFILILFHKLSFSQDIGFHLGVNFANQTQKKVPERLPDYKSVEGIRIGVDLTETISKNLNYSLGVGFSQRGANRDWDFTETTFIYKIRSTLNYIEVPISLIYHNSNKKTTPYISVGSYLSFLISSQLAPPSRLDAWELFNKNDFGIKFGTGLRANQVWFEITYDLGLSNVCLCNDRFIIKNRSLSLTARYFPKFFKQKKSS